MSDPLPVAARSIGFLGPQGTFTEEALRANIDECVSGALDNEVHRTAEMLRERESENVKGAAKLLNISEN